MQNELLRSSKKECTHLVVRLHTSSKANDRKLNILLLAEPDTQSGKAKKARSYGTRLMGEVVFWTVLGVERIQSGSFKRIHLARVETERNGVQICHADPLGIREGDR